MRCVFCKKNSDLSRSIEHIVPESLWNKRNTLPKGIVCDSCNNYFARKVENPFLSSTAIKTLRFHQAIPSKKGKIPSIKAILNGKFPVTLYQNPNESLPMHIDMTSEAFDSV